ncbi:uncharacterized protein HMPREF1541_10962 [Cyphellophora europaea CBS 101466]|uniref:PPM-type phosphatase domain-containing protein n=1 Tax=Cyphellophora europaea (strain CBS 101466) TaxID=1220924 RepID=W2S568_CYPE1|nr:uncharacterized protein HMPREF1541_10962 [Cyphellophora europaea CBS 101466]ETN43831.1 hypothetical protein HMPREF1541_10962 [Cyphellophora europaea CBS 101466]
MSLIASSTEPLVLIARCPWLRLTPRSHRRLFHDYFVTHLPSSSLHPDSRSSTGLAHKFPRKESTPHKPDGRSPAALRHPTASRDVTTVRIPLKSAKHHYGVSVSRGSRPYQEDNHQAGVINLPAFAKRPPRSLRLDKSGEGTSADGESGDPQVFYFGVFDGHGGAECSGYLREQLHQYIEQSALDFGLKSSLQNATGHVAGLEDAETVRRGEKALQAIDTRNGFDAPTEEKPLPQDGDNDAIATLEKNLVDSWKALVGGYFRRFKPQHFSIFKDSPQTTTIEEVLMYAFLKCDYDFVSAQAAKRGEERDVVRQERPLNEADILGETGKRHVDPRERFKGGSTASVALISTPSPVPFWAPATSSTLVVAHCGDTRILLCGTANGSAVPLTSVHHPSSPLEAARLRRFGSFVTDSFGEERTTSGLANSKAFGDAASKAIGVSAEPEIVRIDLSSSEYSFLLLFSDGISESVTDQECVDIVKEAKSPSEGAAKLVSFATEISQSGDNCTCLCVRLGGWERRQEGGMGSLGTKESREFKREQAADPRSRRR